MDTLPSVSKLEDIAINNNSQIDFALFIEALVDKLRKECNGFPGSSALYTEERWNNDMFVPVYDTRGNVISFKCTGYRCGPILTEEHIGCDSCKEIINDYKVIYRHREAYIALTEPRIAKLELELGGVIQSQRLLLETMSQMVKDLVKGVTDLVIDADCPSKKQSIARELNEKCKDCGKTKWDESDFDRDEDGNRTYFWNRCNSFNHENDFQCDSCRDILKKYGFICTRPVLPQ